MTRRLISSSWQITAIALLALLASSHSLFARILNVPFDHNLIQSAIDAAQPNDTILVRPGNYQENLNLNGKSLVIGSLMLTTGQERYIGETVIDGGWNGRSAVRMAAAENGVFTGFTIQNDSSDFGGGIYIRGGAPTISHLVIEHCKAARNGGALYATGGAHPIIRNVVLRHNEAWSIGGAMSIYSGVSAVIENAVIYDNYAGHVGGAIHAFGAEVQLRNCTIVRNAALHSGGAVYLTQSAKVEATDCIFYLDEPDEVWILAGFMGTTFTSGFCNIDGYQQRIYAPAGADLVWKVGNIGADPLFTDLDGWDLTLAEDSPCIDAGHYESTPDPDGTRRDIGRYSFTQQQGGQRVRIVPTGYNTIQRAIDAAAEGDVVFVRPGTYRENVMIDSKNLLVGSRILTTGDTAYIDSTIIDGRGQSYGVAFTGQIGRETVLKGFTVQNGRQNFGGGIDCRQGTAPTLEDLKVSNNTAVQWGGGVYCTGGAAPLLRRVAVQGNSAARGGGMTASYSFPVIEESMFTGNSASDRGGGICGIHSAFVIEQTLIGNNSAGQQGGGGLYLWDCETDSTIHLDHLTISGNTSEAGGGFDIGGLAVEVEDNPFNLELSNSIIYGNNGAEADLFTSHEDVRDRLTASITYTDLRNGFEGIGQNQAVILNWGEGNFDSDPTFVDPDAGDYHLAEGSPCIDAGNPAFERDPDGTVNDLGAYYYHQFIERDPAILHVPDDYYTIQSAIDASMNLDTILVATGSYRENLDYKGKNIVVASEYLHDPNPRFIRETIIDGGEAGPCVQFVRNEVFNTRLIGFTLINGSAREGGGVFCFRAHPTIQNCVLTGNSASDGGGGIYCYGAQPTLVNLTIVGNDGTIGGGGIYCRNLAQPRISNCIIGDNVGAEIMCSADRDQSTVYVSYTDLEGGEGGIALQDNGFVEWEEGNFDADPRFVDAEAGDFSLAEDSPCIDAGDPGGADDPDGTRADVGALFRDSRPEGDEFSIPLTRGWNLIGSPVTPPEPAMTTVWSDLAANGVLQMLKDQNGRFYQPARGFNNMPPWDARQGYLVKMSADATLTIRGETLAADAPIPLRRGWSFVSYQPPAAVSPVDGFAGVVEQIILVKDAIGRFYSPGHNFNSIPELHQGAGYKVQTSLAAELVWGGAPERARARDNKMIDAVERIPVYFAAAEPTGEDMSLLIEATGATESGVWEISVFTEAGFCVGAGTMSFPRRWESIQAKPEETFPENNGAVTASPSTANPPRLAGIEVGGSHHSANRGGLAVDGEVGGLAAGSGATSPLLVGIPIRGDDPTTAAIDGATAGEALVIRVWDGAREFAVAPVWKEGAASYSTDGFALAALDLADGLHLTPYTLQLSAFPNPFNSFTTISYTLPKAGWTSMDVMNLNGRLVTRLVSARQEAGEYRAVWNGNGAGSGIYFLKLQAGRDVRMQKMMLVK